MERKNFLRTFALAAVAGPMVIDGCKKDATTTSSSSTTSTTGTTSTSTTASSSSGCIVTPTEVEGPYPYPTGGEISNPLNRSDVTGGQTGVPLTLTFIVVNTNDNCNVIENARVDIWHCNKDGYYSGYANQNSSLGTKSYVGETWLRGYQTSDSTGTVKFTTIFPGWYSGRATHIHFEVFINSVMKKTSQMAFSKTIADAVQTSTLYASHGANPTSNSSDGIFGDSATDLANETISLAGSVSDGYAGSLTIGIAL